MNRALSIVGVIVAVACASSQQGPDVAIHLAQINMPTDVFYYAGPVNVQYQITVTNPTGQPLTLQRLDLSTIGPGAYSLRANSTTINLKVPPNGTSTFRIAVWGYARGGYMASTEPVTLRGTAYFQGPKGSFVKLFNENIRPLG